MNRVREHPDADEITTVAEEVPELVRVEFVPESGKPGTDLQLRIFTNDSARNLLPSGVFVRNERNGRLLPVREGSEAGEEFLTATIHVEADCLPGQYNYQITAIDEVGNLRRWNGTYTVASSR